MYACVCDYSTRIKAILRRAVFFLVFLQSLFQCLPDKLLTNKNIPRFFSLSLSHTLDLSLHMFKQVINIHTYTDLSLTKADTMNRSSKRNTQRQRNRNEREIEIDKNNPSQNVLDNTSHSCRFSYLFMQYLTLCVFVCVCPDIFFFFTHILHGENPSYLSSAFVFIYEMDRNEW